jgi:hypothetical protein
MWFAPHGSILLDQIFQLFLPLLMGEGILTREKMMNMTACRKLSNFGINLTSAPTTPLSNHRLESFSYLLVKKDKHVFIALNNP